MQPFKHSFMMSVQNKIWGIYVRMSQEKKFLEKNLAIKTLEKKSEFSQVLGKNVTGNKVLCFGFLGLFFLK